MFRITQIKVKNLSTEHIKKLKIIHRKIFTKKFYVYTDPDDIVYICQTNSSNKYIAMGYIRFASPEFHFANEYNDEKTENYSSIPYLIDFGVIPEKRRHGIGTYLMNFIINSLASEHNYINLDILNGRRKDPDEELPFIPIQIDYLISFYELFGFKKIDINWYHPNNLDRYLCMTLKLK